MGTEREEVGAAVRAEGRARVTRDDPTARRRAHASVVLVEGGQALSWG